MKPKLPEGFRVYSFDTVVHLKGLSGRPYRSKVWVVVAPSADGDSEMAIVTHRYLSYAGLSAALHNGAAWLEAESNGRPVKP